MYIPECFTDWESYTNVATTLRKSCENVAKLRCFNVIKESYTNVATTLRKSCENIVKLELVYLPKGKYCVYPRMLYRLAIVMPPQRPSAILDDRKSLLIAFLAISDQYATFIFLHDRKSLSITFLAISDQYATLIFF